MVMDSATYKSTHISNPLAGIHLAQPTFWTTVFGGMGPSQFEIGTRKPPCKQPLDKVQMELTKIRWAICAMTTSTMITMDWSILQTLTMMVTQTVVVTMMTVTGMSTRIQMVGIPTMMECPMDGKSPMASMQPALQMLTECSVIRMAMV